VKASVPPQPPPELYTNDKPPVVNGQADEAVQENVTVFIFIKPPIPPKGNVVQFGADNVMEYGVPAWQVEEPAVVMVWNKFPKLS
jgi:hypothetical protein